MSYCCINGCSSTNRKRVVNKFPDISFRWSFFKFPKDESLYKKWVFFCARKNLNYKSATICSRHFSNDMFKRSLRSKVFDVNKRKFLKPNAFPTEYGPTTTLSLIRRKYLTKNNKNQWLATFLKEGGPGTGTNKETQEPTQVSYIHQECATKRNTTQMLAKILDNADKPNEKKNLKDSSITETDCIPTEDVENPLLLDCFAHELPEPLQSLNAEDGIIIHTQRSSANRKRLPRVLRKKALESFFGLQGRQMVDNKDAIIQSKCARLMRVRAVWKGMQRQLKNFDAANVKIIEGIKKMKAQVKVMTLKEAFLEESIEILSLIKQ